MKKMLLSVVLLLGFLLTTGFSIDPGLPQVPDHLVRYPVHDIRNEYQVNRDTATIEVTFQNPRVIVSDERASEAITTYLKERDSISHEVAAFLGRVVSVIEQDQERRYESALDYLSQVSNLSSYSIQTNIEQAIKRNTILKLFYSIVVVVVLSVWWLITKNLLIDWQQRAVQLGVLITFLVTLYILYCAILRILMPTEYLFLNELLKLSSG